MIWSTTYSLRWKDKEALFRKIASPQEGTKTSSNALQPKRTGWGRGCRNGFAKSNLRMHPHAGISADRPNQKVTPKRRIQLLFRCHNPHWHMVILSSAKSILYNLYVTRLNEAHPC